MGRGGGGQGSGGWTTAAVDAATGSAAASVSRGRSLRFLGCTSTGAAGSSAFVSSLLTLVTVGAGSAAVFSAGSGNVSMEIHSLSEIIS